MSRLSCVRFRLNAAMALLACAWCMGMDAQTLRPRNPPRTFNRRLTANVNLRTAHYYCVERWPRGDQPVFLCKDSETAARHMEVILDRDSISAVQSGLSDLAEVLGLARGTPLAMCAEHRGFAPVAVPALEDALAGRGQIAADISALGGDVFQISGVTAASVAAGCSGTGAGGGGAGPGGQADTARGPRGGMAAFIRAGNRLTVTQRDLLIAGAHDTLAAFSKCKARTGTERIEAGGGGGVGEVLGAATDLFETIMGGFFEEAGRQKAQDLFEEHFIGESYEKDGTLIDTGITRHKSIANPEGSYLDVYGEGNAAHLPAGTKKTTNAQAPGGTYTATGFPDGSFKSTKQYRNGVEHIIESNGEESRETWIYDQDPLPDGEIDKPKLVKSTTEYKGGWFDPARQKERKTYEYSDGSKVIEHYDADGKLRETQYVKPGDTPGMPLPGPPNANTCEGRAQWARTMLTFCDNQQWQAPSCFAFLLLANGCQDPRLVRPGPDQEELICRNRAAIDSRATACERRKMIEFAEPNRRRTPCALATLDASRWKRDPGWIDPLPVNLRQDGFQAPCAPGQRNCAPARRNP